MASTLIYAAIVETGIVSYRTMTGKRMTVAKGPNGIGVQTGSGPKRPPLPSELLAVVVVFSVYSVIAGDGGNSDRARIGALLGWGTVLATFMTMFSGGGSPAPPPNKTQPQG